MVPGPAKVRDCMVIHLLTVSMVAEMTSVENALCAIFIPLETAEPGHKVVERRMNAG